MRKLPPVTTEFTGVYSGNFLVRFNFLVFLSVLVFKNFSLAESTSGITFPENIVSVNENTSYDPSLPASSKVIYLGYTDEGEKGIKIHNKTAFIKQVTLLSPGPSKGALTEVDLDPVFDENGVERYKRSVTYTPYPHAEGTDQFIWNATDTNGDEHNYTCKILIAPSLQPAQIFAINKTDGPIGQNHSLSFEEEQNLVANLQILDPDPNLLEDDIKSIDVKIFGTDAQYFSVTGSDQLPAPIKLQTPTRNGWSWDIPLRWKSGVPPNFEGSDQILYNLDIEVTESSSSGGQTTTANLSISLTDLPEGPQNYFKPILTVKSGQQVIPNPPDFPEVSIKDIGLEQYKFFLQEGGDTNLTIPFSLYAPDRKENGKAKDIKVYYNSTRSMVQDPETKEIVKVIPPELEVIEVGFSQKAEIIITQVDAGKVTDFNVTNGGFGYDRDKTPTLYGIGDTNDDRNLSLTLIEDPFSFTTEIKGSLSKEILAINHSDSGFEIGDVLYLSHPSVKNFRTIKDKAIHSDLESSETESVTVPSYSDGEIRISFPNSQTFQPSVLYNFYAQDESGSVAKNAGGNIPFLSLSIQVDNDYKDSISLFAVYPSDLPTDGINSPHLIEINENSLEMLVDFDAMDPDSSSIEEERYDKDGGEEGNRILYEIRWGENNTHPFKSFSPSKFFNLSDEGHLAFKSPENLPDDIKNNTLLFPKYLDFDETLKGTTGDWGHLFWYIDVVVKDSEGAEGNHIPTEDTQSLKIEIVDVPEEPLYVNSAGIAIANLPSYSIVTKENKSWEFSTGMKDVHGNTINLRAKDFDFFYDASGTNYKTPDWKELVPPRNGTIIDLVQDSDENDVRRVKGFKYVPEAGFWGTDEFELYFGNADQSVKFLVDVNNTSDKPQVGAFKIYDQSVSTLPIEFSESELMPIGNTFVGLELSESINRIFEITFQDNQDFDSIDEIIVSGKDKDLFEWELLPKDPNRDWEQTIQIYLKKLLDRESFPTSEDPQFSLDLRVIDSSAPDLEKSNQNDFFLRLSLPDEDEPPELKVNDKPHGQVVYAAENQNIAIERLKASDPEGTPKIYKWEIFGGDHEHYFKLSNDEGNITQLLFEKIPNYENLDERELNVTLLISDMSITGIPDDDIDKYDYYPLTVKIYGKNDLPIQIQSQSTVDEPNKEIDQSLKDFFYDEDGDELFFRLLSSSESGRGPDANFFDSEVVKTSQKLVFKEPSDHERSSQYKVTVRVFDDKQDGFSFVDKNITILVNDVNEAPQVRLGIKDPNASPGTPPIYNIDQEVITHYTFEGDEAWDEDTEKWIDIFYFFDPEDSTPNSGNLTYTVIGEPQGDLKMFPSAQNPNGTFKFTPPQDYYNAVDGVMIDDYLQLELNVTDQTFPPQSSIFTLLFQVNNVDDPPKIVPLVDDPQVTLLNTDSLPWQVGNYEGNLKVLLLQADDSIDPSPSSIFEWRLEGDDQKLFKLTQQRANNTEMYLEWNPSDEIDNLKANQTPNYSTQPINPELPNLASPRSFDLTVSVYDKNDTDQASLNSTRISIEILNVLDRPPEFLPSSPTLELSPYTEESDDPYIATLSALDPDELERFDAGKPKRHIVYRLDESTSFSDWKRIDKSSFNTDLNQHLNSPGGELRFLEIPDYERDFYDQDKDPLVKIRVFAYFGEELADGKLEIDESKFSSQIITIPIQNRVEQPFFLSVQNEAIDANFTLLEDSQLPVVFFSGISDVNKNLQISLPLGVHDNDLFEVSSFLRDDKETTEASLKFKSPPNWESPQDFDKNNIYQVMVRASSLSSDNEEVFTSEIFLIKVEDVVSDFNLNGSGYLEIDENTKFVSDLEVYDFENENIFSDLLFTTDEGTFYIPSSESNPNQASLFAIDSIYPIDFASETRTSISADFNNDGSQDVVSITNDDIKIFVNEGFGTFSSNVKNLWDGLNLPSPKDVAVCDFDQDGDQDILISFYDEIQNSGESDLYFFKNTEPENLTFTGIRISVDSIKQPSRIELIDLDGDFDFDIIVVDEAEQKIYWVENNQTSADSPFGTTKELFESSEFSDLRDVKSFNLQNQVKDTKNEIYSDNDILIVDDTKIYIANNLGLGDFKLIKAVEVAKPNFIRAVGSVLLNKDDLTDLVYLDSDGKSLWYSFQNKINNDLNFSLPNEEPIKFHSNLSSQKAISLEIFSDYIGESYSPRILVGASTPPMIYEFLHPEEISLSPGIKFSDPNVYSLNSLQTGGIKTMEQTDLDRAYNHYNFSLNQEYDFELFDENKINSGGKLYFKNFPNFEVPLIAGKDNLFQVSVEYSKRNRSTGDLESKSKLINVQVLDVGEPIIITQPASHSHRENHLTIWESLEVQNPESSYEDLNFSIVHGLDGDFFEIDPGTGRLSFINRKRFEDKDDANGDSIYEVTVRVDEINVLNPFSDQRTFSINLNDGYEPPVLEDQNIYLSIVEDDEDGIFYDLNDFNVTDHPGNITQGLRGASIYKQGGQGIADVEYSISNGKLDGNFSYTGEANASGDDLVILEITNESNLSSFLYVNISISPLNDPPVARVPNLIFHPEGKKLVTPLKAYDSDSSDSQISWELVNDSNNFFEILNNGRDLYFKNKPDFESDQGRNYTASLILTDGYNETFHAINIQITDQIDQAPESLILNNAKANVFTVVERTYDVTDLGVFDKDLGDIVHARVTGGLDKEFFEVINGKLKIKPQYLLNFDSPEDVDSDNTYEVEITLSDTGNLSTVYKIYVRIVNLDDNPPVFLNFDTEASRILKIAENQHFVTKLYANDVEVEDLTFGISQVKDYEMFEINSSDQTLYLVNPLNYENIIQKEADFLLNEKFEVVINVTDGTYTTELTLYIEVTDVNDPPRLNTLTYSLNEDSSITGNLSWSDEDGDSVQLEILNSPMYGSFEFDSISGAFSYFPKKDFNGDDTFRVLTKDDANGSSINDVKLVVLPENDKPVAVEDFYYFFSGEYNQSNPFVFSVLDNDHSGPDDSTEMANYMISISGTNEDVDLNATNQNGEFTFEITDSTSLGAYEFPYLIQDGDLNDTAQAVVWVATLPSLPQWISLRNFGLFYHQPLASNNAWIYHQKMGWVYVSEFSDIYDATWIWHELIGWFWTGDWNAELSRSRWMYANSIKQWIHWEGGIRDSRGWFTRDYADNIYDEDFFVRLNIRNEIIKILPDLNGLISYIETSEYFKDSQKIEILREVNRYKNSPSLDNILEYNLSY